MKAEYRKEAMGTCAVVQYVKPSPEVQASHVGAGFSLTAPLKIQFLVNTLGCSIGSLHPGGRPEEALSAWLWTSLCSHFGSKPGHGGALFLSLLASAYFK